MPSWPLDEPTDPQTLVHAAPASRLELQPRLVQLSGGSRGEVGRVLLLDREQVVIGRASDGVQLQIHDTGVSRRHAAVERVGQGFQVVDLDSSNGTFVNNVRVKVAELRDGDRIQLGTSLLRFTCGASDDEWLHQSLDHGSVALWDYSLGSREVTWSEHADRALHLAQGTLSKRRMPFHAMVHPEDAAQVSAALLLCANAGLPFEQEFRLVVGPEFFRWVVCRAHLLRNGTGQPERLTGTVVDVSDKKKRELELRRMAVMFESLSDASFLTDGAGAIVDLNSAAERLFEVTKPRALGARLLEFVRAPNAGELEVAAQRALKAAGRWSVELLLPRAGAELSFDVVAFPLRTDDGVLGAAFLLRDITERKRLQAQVAFYDRLAALGTLSAGVAHEINNPLSFVLSNIEFVIASQTEKSNPDRAELEALRDALEGARRIVSTVKDMKVFSRDDASPLPVPTDARAPLEMAVKMTQKLVSTRAVVTRQLAEGLPLVSANESRLSQVFINLLVNAAQAIPEGREGRIAVRQRLDGEFVVTEIEDDGPGIPPEQLGRIFDPFFTTKPVGMGTGLGLSICHALVSGFGGELTVRSEPGRGATFTVKLRLAHEQAKTPSAVQRCKERRGRLLLIDDEPLVLRSMVRTLGTAHDVTSVSGADEALALIEHEAFDLILCDVMMPRRTGIQLYEQIDREHPEMASRIIFISGGAFTDRARDFLSRVTNTMLTKPIDVAELSNLIQTRLRDRTGNQAM